MGIRHLWPINPQTPYPATSDGSLPNEYQIILDPLETLTYVAANRENCTRNICYRYSIS
jgi:hypothetical protein